MALPPYPYETLPSQLVLVLAKKNKDEKNLFDVKNLKIEKI